MELLLLVPRFWQHGGGTGDNASQDHAMTMNEWLGAQRRLITNLDISAGALQISVVLAGLVLKKTFSPLHNALRND